MYYIFWQRIIFQKMGIRTGEPSKQETGWKTEERFYTFYIGFQLLMSAIHEFFNGVNHFTEKKRKLKKFNSHSLNAMQWCRSTWTNSNIIHKTVLYSAFTKCQLTCNYPCWTFGTLCIIPKWNSVFRVSFWIGHDERKVSKWK